MVAAEEEKKFEEKNAPTGDDLQERKETELLAEDPTSSSSSIVISLMVAGVLATSEQLAVVEQDASKATASLDRFQKGQHVHFNVHSKKGSYYYNTQHSVWKGTE